MKGVQLVSEGWLLESIRFQVRVNTYKICWTSTVYDTPEHALCTFFLFLAFADWTGYDWSRTNKNGTIR
jgi:hypothetical protein